MQSYDGGFGLVPGSESHGTASCNLWCASCPTEFVISRGSFLSEFQNVIIQLSFFFSQLWVLIVCLCVSESGGGTFCAVAALCLMGFIQADLASNLQEPSSIDVCLLLEWCLQVKFCSTIYICYYHQNLPFDVIYRTNMYFQNWTDTICSTPTRFKCF